jgi:hypothetical protein
MPGAKTGCCMTTFIVAAAITVFTLGGILIWQFLPEDTKQSVLDFGDLDNNATLGDTIFGGSDNDPDLPSYEFIQCDAATDTNCCNGLSGLCDLRANEIMYGYLHNAPASRDKGWFLAPNHENSLELALTAGYRAMELDVGRCGGDAVFFHAQCVLGTRSITTVLTNIVTFLQENPSEILVLTLEMTSGQDVTVTLQQVAAIMDTVDGFNDYLYQHNDGDWPTLGELVQADTRIILFYHELPDCTQQVCPRGFHFWFQYGVNTQFDFGDIDDLKDTAASCELFSAGANSKRDFFRVNAFVRFPSSRVAETVNSNNILDDNDMFVQERVQACSAANQDLPVNFYSVDFWSQGNLPQFVQEYNQKLISVRRKNQRRSVRSLVAP